jgi:hypothetical protein
MWHAHLAVVRTFVRSIDAEIARSALEAAGLVVVLQRDDCGGAQPAQWMAGIRLLVDRADLAMAREILEAPTIYSLSHVTAGDS